MPPSPILSHPVDPAPGIASSPGRSALRIVLAPNAFKGTLSPAEAAAAMATGVLRAQPSASLAVLPIADGGDGSVDAFLASGFTALGLDVRGPLGDPLSARAAVNGDEAVVELADCCGMARLPVGVLAPMTSTTLGLGDAIRGVLDSGAASVLACLGGSASTDGGTGLLVALGGRLLDRAGAEVPPGGAHLDRIASLDLDHLDHRLASVRITAAVDVDSPLVGSHGAAAVFAPQKGATPDQVTQLDDGLRSWARVLATATGHDMSDVPGAGAAGGSAAALAAACGATIAPGARVIADLVGLDRAVADCDLVITGEGRLDTQSARGKGTLAVASLGRAAGVPVLAVCGSITLDVDALTGLGLAGWGECGAPAAEGAAGRLAGATEAAVRAWAGS